MAFFKLLALLPAVLMTASSEPSVLRTLPYIQVPLKGIYLTSSTIANVHGEKLITQFKELGGTMVVFDIQDSNGKLAYESKITMSRELGNHRDQIKNLAETVAKIHEQDMYATARFVLFKNGFLAKKKPQWTLKRKGTPRPFVSRDGPIWLDPGHPELVRYLLEISWEIAQTGVDEIQFDYARFPEGGQGGYIGYSFTGDDYLRRDEAITNTVGLISSALSLLGTKVSVDVFGIVVWDDVSWRVIGQNIPELAKYVDAIYPMPYPSHFGPGWGGHRNPADEPYFFVQETTKKFIELAQGTKAKIRPWLQGFAMRVSRYGSGYVKEQIRALKDIGIEEFSIWNASNNYAVSFGGVK